ncbi:probable 2-oxoglutarate-dependent dioxygenase AOP1 [Jatropha curcas]|uniref:probable 2-oxoglutarate-dependent dioxygenase AOP1 n=1 Tax=Jatropha curcas TaxID=180498 RepID=UPI00189626EF|nr:probable 2-oxoglutarate-dependent dioxygenase AOP1 [Jatropha curcas]
MGSLSNSKLPVIDFASENLEAAGTSGWVSKCKDVLKALEEYGCFVAVYESMAITRAETLEGIQDFTKTMWPNGNNNFCKIVHSYTKTVEELHKMVVKMIFDGYGMEKYYESHMESTTYFSRFLNYIVPQENETKQGLHPHMDKSFLTILHQNDVSALQIKPKNGEWLDVHLASSDFLVLAGEGIMGWSNDRIDGCDHRVTIKSKEKRLSVGLFSFVKGIMQVPEEFVDDDHPLMYKPFDHIGLLHFFGTPEGHKQHHSLKAYKAAPFFESIYRPLSSFHTHTYP